MHAAFTTAARYGAKKALRIAARASRKRRCRAPRSIGYLVAGGMGDGIMTLPALAFLKKNVPGARIDVYVPQNLQQLLRRLMQPFTVLPFSAGAALLRAATGRAYDLTCSNTIAAFRVAYEVHARLAGRYAAGFRYPEDKPRDRLYDYSLAIEENQHDSDQNLTLAAGALGLPFEEPDRYYPTLDFAGPAPATATQTVVIHPGAGREYRHKQWPSERYQEIIRRLLLKKHAVTVLLGPDDAHLFSLFSAMHGTHICHSIGPDPLFKTLSSCRLFIGNDSGPAHCAALFGIPTIVLFGPTSAARNAPRGSESLAIEGMLPCSPCHFRSAPCGDNQCLKSIQVDQVWNSIEEILKRTGM
ncbi:MAG: glycosyltransferase family 9 protein [Chitinispirillaceae bacterium]|nr:glycosyltransferase family 9 protein [Chitinispirillaceae bacterium]